MGVSGRVSDEEELDGDEENDDDGGEYDIGDDDTGEADSLGNSGSGSHPIMLKSSEWCDDRNDILELKELGERGLRGGGVRGMAISRGLALS